MSSKLNDPIQTQLIAARRNQILDAAIKVFAQKGFHPATIKDVAKEAGIADGTIYNYFKNKHDLMLGILERMKETVLQEVDVSQLMTLDLRSVIKAYLHYPLMALKSDNFELFRVVISEIMVNPELRGLYAEKILAPTLQMAEPYFHQWAAQRAINPLHIQLTLRAISGMVMGLMLQYIMGDETLKAHWDEVPDFLTDLLMNGLAQESS